MPGPIAPNPPPPSPSQPPRMPRPPRPAKRARGKYYWASMVLAVVFLVLMLSLPLFMEVVRRGSRPLPTSAPEVLTPSRVPPTGPSASTAAGVSTASQVNTECRGYVYARCNALGLEPGPCVRVAVVAMKVPMAEGMPACRAAVDPLMREAAVEAGLPVGAPPVGEAGGAPEPPPAEPAAAVPDPSPAGDAGPPPPRDRKDADKPAAKAGKAEDPPALQAERLQKMADLLDELQRAGNNYATPPAAQVDRLDRLRALVEADGTPETRALFNGVVERYRPQGAPQGGGIVGESEAVEVRGDGRSPTTTPEVEAVRSMMDEARQRANLPPAPSPSDRPTEAVPTPAAESPASAAPGEMRPSGAAQEYRP